MKIKTLKQHNCEPVISGRDMRYEIVIDDVVKVQVVQCHDRDHARLGDVQLELVEINEQKFYPSNFSELPSKYCQDTLENAIFNHLN